MATVAILEDSPHAIASMRYALEAPAQALCLNWQLLQHCTHSAAMIEWLNQNPVDVLVCDLELPDFSGLAVIAHCAEHYPKTEIMVCTVFEDDSNIFESLRQGASGYILKSDITRSFTHSLDQIMQGGSPMSPKIARRILAHLNPKPALPQSPTKLVNDAQLTLTPKELEVLDLVSRGFRHAEIAQHMNVSVNTISTHAKNIYKKLQVNSKGEAVFEARQLGFIT
jgi:DNA-binding NarL/FixJ family response regulator